MNKELGLCVARGGAGTRFDSTAELQILARRIVAPALSLRGLLVAVIEGIHIDATIYLVRHSVAGGWIR